MFSERTHLRLSKHQLAELKRRAKRDKKSVAAVIRDAIDEHLGESDEAERQASLERLFAINAPVDDWPVMKAQVLKGALGERWKNDDRPS